MSYSAIIFDLDGTAIPNRLDGMPSPVVIAAVQKAQQSARVMCATGRPLIFALPIINALKLTDPCVVAGGTQIYDPGQQNIIWQQNIAPADVDHILRLCRDYPYEVLFNADEEGHPAQDRRNDQEIFVIYVMRVSVEDTPIILQSLEQVEGIRAHTAPSWAGPEIFDIHITHHQATKRHAIALVLQQQQLDPAQVIGVGDGANDLPLFLSVGLKVAMGNAHESLKQAADHVTGSVDEDGLAQAIEKFLL